MTSSTAVAVMDMKNPYVQQWNAGVQQELLSSFNPATNVPVAGPRGLAATGFNSDIQYVENNGISNYNSLQARLEKRFTAGLSALVSYTWGKALSDSVDHLSTSGTGSGVDVGGGSRDSRPIRFLGIPV